MKLFKNRKKLNNKGFTLIELLAVVVILAVVMGVAMTSVLSSMNNSRMGSLTNSAEKVAQAFQTKYSEAMVTNSLNDIYGDVIGKGKGYNFTAASTTSPVFYGITLDLSEDMNLSGNAYVLGAKLTTTAAPNLLGENTTEITANNSFIAFNGNSVVACMIAKNTGSYYVANAAIKDEKTEVIHGINVKFAADTMYSCSIDDMNSWTSSTVS